MKGIDLKIARIKAGKKQYEVAARLGIPQTRLCEIKRGKATLTVPDDMAFERVVESTAFVLDQLELSYRQTRERAQGWFRLSLIAACVGFALLSIGVVTAIFGQTTAGVITVISSVISEAVAALFFVQLKAANQRVDTIQANLTEAREVQTAVEIANTMSDPTAQDNLKAEIVRKALQLEKSASDLPPTPSLRFPT